MGLDHLSIVLVAPSGALNIGSTARAMANFGVSSLRLVAPQTDPSWTPLFIPAGGVVVDVGALNSHSIIVSRELGIPCVVSVVNATRRIPDGAMIEVNGDLGTVTIL